MPPARYTASPPINLMAGLLSFQGSGKLAEGELLSANATDTSNGPLDTDCNGSARIPGKRWARTFSVKDAGRPAVGAGGPKVGATGFAKRFVNNKAEGIRGAAGAPASAIP